MVWLLRICVLHSACFGGLLNAQILLKAYDLEGHELKQAGAGQPFAIEVDVRGLGNVMQKPAIELPDDVTMRSVGYHMSSINGDVTIKHKYNIVAQKAGSYSIGPASIEKDGKKYTSNVITVQVGAQAVAVAPPHASKSAQVAFLELTVDKDRVVVGEKIQCTLRFYYTDQVLQMAPINKPDYNGFSNDAQQGPTKGTKEIKNKKYAYLEWRWVTRALRPGVQTIGSHSADFTVQASDDLMRHFGFFVHNSGEQKRVYSNAVNISVDPLPTHEEPVHGIGSFSHMSVRIQPTTAKVGEGMVLTVAVDGDGTLDSKNCAQLLQGLPTEFKYYDSKQYVAEKKHADSVTQHCFEFIVQGIKAGSYQIPSFQFTFFDINTRRYKTLESKPIDVEIVQLAAHGTSKAHEPSNQNHAQIIPEDIRSVHAYVPSFSLFSYAIPWWLFFILILIPLAIFYSMVGRTVVVWLMQRIAPYRKKRQTFAHVRAQIAQAEKSRNYSTVYSAFKAFFAAQHGLEPQLITHEMIEQELKQHGFSDAELVQWNDFFNALAEQVFFGNQKTLRVDLISQARAWIQKFEACGSFKSK